MKLQNQILLFVAFVALAFTSCKSDKKDDTGETGSISSIAKVGSMPKNDAALMSIPSEVTQLTVIRIPQLMKKADFNSMKEMGFYQDAIKEASQKEPLLGDVLRDPAKSGLDLNRNAYVFMDVNPLKIDQSLTSVVFNMADKSKFEKVVKASKEAGKIIKSSGYQSIVKENGFLAWNDKIACLGGGESSAVNTSLDKVFNLDKSASVYSASPFKSVLTSGDDISFQYSTDAFAENAQLTSATSMLGWSKDDLKGNYVQGGMNFEEKKMVAHSKYKLNKTIAADLGMPFKSKLSTDFSPYIPKDNLSAVFTVGLDLKGMLQLLKEKGVLGLLKMRLSQLKGGGINIEEIAEAIDGDMFFASQEGETSLIGLKIDESKFQKYLTMIEQSGEIKNIGDGVYTVKSRSLPSNLKKKGEPRLIIKDNMLFIANTDKMQEVILAGGFPKNERISKEEYKKISNGFIGGKGFGKFLSKNRNEFKGMDIETFTFSSNKENGAVEVTSEEDGNFLKTLVKAADRNQKNN